MHHLRRIFASPYTHEWFFYDDILYQEKDQELREKIAEIGRKAEKAMLIATDGINTHKGVIWAMGLLTSVTADGY